MRKSIKVPEGFGLKYINNNGKKNVSSLLFPNEVKKLSVAMIKASDIAMVVMILSSSMMTTSVSLLFYLLYQGCFRFGKSIMLSVTLKSTTMVMMMMTWTFPTGCHDDYRNLDGCTKRNREVNDRKWNKSRRTEK